jgi:single-stranded-DNA-specific exonuclease
MKFELIQKPNEKYSAREQILINRGIKYEDIQHYTHTTDKDILPPEAFGEDLLKAAAGVLLETIKKNGKAVIIVDADCDGYTSAALLGNYLYDAFPSFYDGIEWFMHEGKQHGLADAMMFVESIGPDLVIIPDAGSNDYEFHKQLQEDGIKVLILDHHEAEQGASQYAITINNQLSDYDNKFLSGVGVVWQFCRYLDKIMQTEYSYEYLDLVALGLMADMMSLQSIETKHLIQKGFEPANIKNPFIFGMWEKNRFKLGDNITPMGAAFYIAPFVNAMVRSGTMEEKELLFSSMLKDRAFVQIPSNKRGHKVGEMERVVDQALRTATNVKNRQTRAEEAGMNFVEGRIADDHMLEKHKVLMFLLEPGDVDKNIAGLIANKIMAKYQRPCCMLTKTEVPIEVKSVATPSVTPLDDPGYISISKEVKTGIVYSGSARGCDKVGITEFKDICAGTGLTEFVAGHQGAFGLGIKEENMDEFMRKTDEALKDMPDEATYRVDYIWDARVVDPAAIIEIGEMDAYWGKDMDEALVAVTNIQITKDMLTMMKSNTAKITLPGDISIIKFRMPDEEFEQLYSETGFIEIDAVCKCNINEWNGNRYAQLFLEDYNIKGKCAYVF